MKQAIRPAIFKWRQTEPELILCAVRWYLRYSLSFRDVEELLSERGLEADHTTIWRWVQRYGPELEERLRRHLKPTNRSVQHAGLLSHRVLGSRGRGTRFSQQRLTALRRKPLLCGWTGQVASTGGNRGGSGSARRPPDRRCATPCASGGRGCRRGGRRAGWWGHGVPPPSREGLGNGL